MIVAEYTLKYTAKEIENRLEQVEVHTANISQLSEDINNIGGTIEVTSGEPTKENTVVTISPSSEITNIYTAEEVDAKFEQMSEEIDEQQIEIDKLTMYELADCSQLVNGGIYDGFNREYILPDGSATIRTNLTIKNVHLKNESGAFLTFGGASCECVFENCLFDNVMFVIWSGGNNYVFKNCIFINCTKSPIAVMAANNNITVDSCQFLHERPNLDAWNNNTDGIRSFGSAVIYVYGNNNNCDIVNNSFIDNVASQVVFVPSATTGTKMTIRNNVIRDTFGGCIVFENAVEGIVANNIFENVGGIRGNYSYFVANENLGVGCNAMYCLKCVDLKVIGNKVFNVVENGIEGLYHSVCDNHVENAGYRYTEGYTTQSTECYYVLAKVITGNVAINPLNKSAFIINGISNYFDKAIIAGNKALSDTGGITSAFLLYGDKNSECECIVRNNIGNNFTALYETLQNSPQAGFVFENETERQFYCLTNDCFKKSKFVSTYKKLYLPNSKEIINSNSTMEVIQEDGVNVLHLHSDDIYGHLYIQGVTECKGVPCGVKIIIKSDKPFKISCASEDNAGNIPATDAFAVYGGQQYTYDAPVEYSEISGIYPAYGNYKLLIWCTEASQDIYIKKIEVTM